ncbi:hypothetical protein LTR08_000092 [Meristemomyces frigidus]|nr:hypothetical protein LTR08_000092 [Meristemomyces frigidus]
MSLYHEAASVLNTARKDQVSLKSLVYSKKGWKSDLKTLFALSTEAAKWSEVLSEVLERSGVLRVEKTLTPTLALVLTHDLFLSKRGIALPATHGLHASVARHKARISAELTKARLRRGCATLEALRASVNQQPIDGAPADDQNLTAAPISKPPRWVRINTLQTTLKEQLKSTFAEYEQVASLSDVTNGSHGGKRLHIDEHIPNLIAISTTIDLTTGKAYKQGQLILQDKASCFPAYLLNPKPADGDVVDACAAPGNKTTHLAAILQDNSTAAAPSNAKRERKIIACEKDATRSLTLQKMIKLAGGERVISVKAKQDFMKLDPTAKEFANVAALLLDPSCSGSGIVGRDEGGVTVHLPDATAVHDPPSTKAGRKRKRGGNDAKSQAFAKPPSVEVPLAGEEEEPLPTAEDTEAKLHTRLMNLSTFQLRLLQRSMAFPAAKKITYSTCSIHPEENEHVVMKALQSSSAVERGWRIMKRSEQVEGMRKWERRGWVEACQAVVDAEGVKGRVDVREVAEGCIRCEKGSGEGTMGFFVAGFVRDGTDAQQVNVSGKQAKEGIVTTADEEEDEEWGGFGDEA